MMFRDIVNSKSNSLVQYFDAIGENMNIQLQQVVDKYKASAEN
jgi:hypothetical protein